MTAPLFAKYFDMKRIIYLLVAAFVAFAAVSCEPPYEEGSGSNEENERPVEPVDPVQPEKGDVSPDPASGISVDPAYPDADAACVIRFNPVKTSPLYAHQADLYAHLSIIAADDDRSDWSFVPYEWGVNNDRCKFTKVADNSWELNISPSIREFFGSGDTPVTLLALLVRNSDGSLKSGEDQFCSVKDTKYQAETFNPDPVVAESMPADVNYGINCRPDGSVTFVLYDKDKNGRHSEYCYIVGDWNDWKRVPEGAMKRDEAAGCWWITLTGLDPDKEYRFQYRAGTSGGSDLYLSDPYSEIVYDQWNDQYISSSTYPDLPVFPEKAKALVSAFKINEDSYDWKYSDFKIEDDDDLVIYELLIRDFSTTKDLNGVMERLDYIEELGVNAIELMPVQEFDGNLSWGYNPNHYFALDKAYGTRDMYKDFVDECHRRGIAVIIDVVYNHLTGLSTYAKLYYNADKTAASNPWFNVDAPHPYSVFHDINHDNELISRHIKESLAHLLNEYDVDGFRFDLTKGFTQTDSGGDNGDVAKWGRYDQSRVDILKGYADHIWSVNDNAVVIFEHLSDWDEEKVLAQHGMQLWRNVNHEYRTAVSGGTGNFSNMYSTDPFGGYVGYMESHDEERLCYGAAADATSVTWGVIGLGNDWDNDKVMSKDGAFFSVKNVSVAANDRFKIRKAGEWNDAFNYGASSDNYKLTVGLGYQMTNGSSSKDMYVPAAGTYDFYFSLDTETVWLMPAGQRPADPSVGPGESEDPLTVAMRRAGASAAFFLTVPGPKMIWQFGEIGYDYTIEHNGRTGEKPVVTDEYMAEPARKALYDTYAVLLKFRRENPRFFDKDASFQWTPSGAVKKITCTVDGKTFHVVGNFGSSSTSYTLPTGRWNDYINGGSVSGTISLKNGEFRLLTNF